MNDILPLLLQNSISYIKENKKNPIIKEFLLEILDDILQENRHVFHVIKTEIMKL